MHVIVHTPEGIPLYYSLSVGKQFGTHHGWTEKKDDALQFARAKDAQSFVDVYLVHASPFATIQSHEGTTT